MKSQYVQLAGPRSFSFVRMDVWFRTRWIINAILICSFRKQQANVSKRSFVYFQQLTSNKNRSIYYRPVQGCILFYYQNRIYYHALNSFFYWFYFRRLSSYHVYLLYVFGHYYSVTMQNKQTSSNLYKKKRGKNTVWYKKISLFTKKKPVTFSYVWFSTVTIAVDLGPRL